jgi:DNA-binding GntR family transcriptional regulator
MRELTRTTLLDSAIQALRQAFLNGEFKPGERLSEPELCQRLGVSRSTVREALRHLDQEGWVTRIPFKGTFARTLSEKDLRELNSLRAALEAFACELVVERATDEDIAGLASIIDGMANAATSGDAQEALQLHFRFHQRLCELSGHSLLQKHWSMLASQVGRALKLSPEVYGFLSDGGKLLSEHRPIAEALASRDLTRVRAILRHHITLL